MKAYVHYLRDMFSEFKALKENVDLHQLTDDKLLGEYNFVDFALQTNCLLMTAVARES